MTGASQGHGRRRSVLVGLIGQGVTPSLTPPMHELEGARHGMSYVYRTIDIAPEQALVLESLEVSVPWQKVFRNAD